MTPNQNYTLSIKVSTSAYLLHYKKRWLLTQSSLPTTCAGCYLNLRPDLRVEGRFPRSKLPLLLNQASLPLHRVYVCVSSLGEPSLLVR